MTLALVAAMAIGQDQPPPAHQYELAMKAPAGTQAAYDVHIAFEVTEVPAEYKARQVRTVVKSRPEGWAIQHQESSAQLFMVGAKMEFKDLPPKTFTYGPDGALIKVEGKTTDPADSAFARLTSFYLPGRPVKLNEVWNISLPADQAQGLKAFEAACRVTGEDKVNGTACHRIACEVSERSGESPAGSKSGFWLDKDTGMIEKATAQISRAPLAGNWVAGIWTLTKVQTPAKKPSATKPPAKQPTAKKPAPKKP